MKTRILLATSVILALSACGTQSAQKLQGTMSGSKMTAAEKAELTARTDAGGQPGLITLKGVAVSTTTNQPDSHIKISQATGKSTVPSRAIKVADENLPSYGSIDDTTEQAQLDKLKDDTTYINLGCDLSKVDPNLIHGFKDATPANLTATASTTAAAAAAGTTTAANTDTSGADNGYAPAAIPATNASATTSIAPDASAATAPSTTPASTAATTTAGTTNTVASAPATTSGTASTPATTGTKGKDCTKDSAATDLSLDSTTLSANVVLMCTKPANLTSSTVEINANNLVMIDMNYAQANSKGGIYMAANKLTLDGVNSLATSGLDAHSIVSPAPYIQLDVATEIDGTGSLGLSSTGGNAIAAPPKTSVTPPPNNRRKNVVPAPSTATTQPTHPVTASTLN